MAIHTPAAIAETLHCTSKELRVYLRLRARALGQPIPGKGSRWAIDGKELASIRAGYRKHETALLAARAKRAADAAEMAAGASDQGEASEEQGEA